MVIRLVESLLITTYNRLRRGWMARHHSFSKPMAEPEAAAPPDAVVIGHVIKEQESRDEIIAADLLGRGIVALTAAARRRHLYVLGATGTGKTNLLLNLIESDIRHGRAFCVIDLRGDLVDRIIPRMAAAAPPGEWQRRLLLLDLRNSDHVVGFNPLAGEDEPYHRAMHVLSVLRMQADSWGIQLEETLRNSLVALASTNWTLLELDPLLTNGSFRAQVLSEITDLHVRSFFERYEALSEQNRLAWSLAALNKVTPLLAIPQLRLMFGQRESFAFRPLLDYEPGMVILVSLAIDRLHHAAHQVGGLLVSALQSAIMARVDQPEGERVAVHLYADEFEMMASDRFQQIVAEGRRFGLGLHLSHQNLSQLSPDLRNVLRNNVHTQVYFQTGAGDAAELAREVTSAATREAVKDGLMTQGTGEAFLVRRGKPTLRIRTIHSADPPTNPDIIEALKQMSLATYGRQRAAIERELTRRAASFAGGGTQKQSPAQKGVAVAAAPAYTIRHDKLQTFKPKIQPPGEG